MELQVDKGEASAIALAKKHTDVLLLLDDLKARKLASKLDLKYSGTVGIIQRAKREGIIEKVKPLLDEILKTDFRVSEKIITEILLINNEIE